MSIEITEPGGASNPYIDRIRLVQGDIAEQDADAVIAAIPQNLRYEGEINTALMAGAGAALDQFLRENVIRPRAGDLYAIPGFGLPCRHIFFCIVPCWRLDIDRHDRILIHAARKALETAREMSLKTLAFPPLLTGRNGYPKPRAARLILRGICDRLGPDIDEIRLVCRSEKTRSAFQERLTQSGWLES